MGELYIDNFFAQNLFAFVGGHSQITYVMHFSAVFDHPSTYGYVFGMEESNERRMFTLENPNWYPEGQEPIPIQILEGRSPEGFGLE